MSATITYSGGHNWNYLGRFYGIDPGVLAAYNGKTNVDLDKEVPAGTKLKIPNAAELTQFYPEYRQLFVTAHESFGLLLRTPTVTKVSLRYPYRSSSNGRVFGRPFTFGDPPLVTDVGNQVVVNSARMRRFGHTADNYLRDNPIRSPNPAFHSNRSAPDTRTLGLDDRWKCNAFVGDVMYTSGFDWPMSEFKRYLGPDGLMQVAMRANPYYDVIWQHQRYANGNVDPTVASKRDIPTAEHLAGMQPGDVVLLHMEDTDDEKHFLPHHSAIATSKVTKADDGQLVVRLCDIYGEYWARVDIENIAAVVRPKKRLAQVPAVTVGGDAGKPELVLDHSAELDEPTYGPGEDVSDQPF